MEGIPDADTAEVRSFRFSAILYHEKEMGRMVEKGVPSQMVTSPKN